MLEDRRLDPADLELVILGMLGRDRRTRIVALQTNLGTADAFYNSWLPTQGRRTTARALARGKDAYLHALSDATEAVILDTGCGHPHYNAG
jgi:hypothetical protein